MPTGLVPWSRFQANVADLAGRGVAGYETRERFHLLLVIAGRVSAGSPRSVCRGGDLRYSAPDVGDGM